MDTKLTVRVPRHLLENAKRYAQNHQTTLTSMIAAYLENIHNAPDELTNATVVRRLTGLLSSDVSNHPTSRLMVHFRMSEA